MEPVTFRSIHHNFGFETSDKRFIQFIAHSNFGQFVAHSEEDIKAIKESPYFGREITLYVPPVEKKTK